MLGIVLKKQKLNNYDVIESYAEDFTRWRIDNTGVTTTQKKITIAANTELKYNIAYKGFGNSTDGFDIKYTGNIVMRYRYHKEDGTAVAETAAIAGTAANEQYLERKQCADHVQFVNDMWRSTYAQQNQRFEDRQTINQEMFGIYSAMRNGFDVINAAANKNAFDLYKYSRDNKDELMGQIGEMKTELAVLKATRPYQDALIQCDIRRVAEHADFNLWRRTCRMISGEVVLPNTPTVTGYASYNPCACPATTPAPTTAA